MINRKIERRTRELMKGSTPEWRVKRFLFVHTLLRRYVRGEATDREREVIESWRAEEGNSFNSEQLQELPFSVLTQVNERIYRKVAISQEFPQSDWKLVAQQPEVKLAEYEAMINTAHTQHTPKPQKSKLATSLYVGVAAMIAIMFCFVLFQYYTQNEVLQSNHNIISEQLPDNTHIQMNRDSRLTLSNDFNHHSRKVEMTGEIFFEVAKNTQKPFIIVHSVLQTQVKGTSFTICDYPELDVSTITVRTGVVSVSTEGKQIAMLTANKQLQYNKITGKYTVRDRSWQSSAGWIDGKIVWVDANEKEIAMRIKQAFNKELVIDKQALGTNVCFNSEFAPNATLNQVMERLMLVYGTQYKIKGKQVIVYRNIQEEIETK